MKEFDKLLALDIFADKAFDVAERIQFILKDKGIKKIDLARACNGNASEITKWLSGRQNFTLATLAKIEAILGEEIISIKSPKLYEKETEGNSAKIVDFNNKMYTMGTAICNHDSKPLVKGSSNISREDLSSYAYGC